MGALVELGAGTRASALAAEATDLYLVAGQQNGRVRVLSLAGGATVDALGSVGPVLDVASVGGELLFLRSEQGPTPDSPPTSRIQGRTAEWFRPPRGVPTPPPIPAGTAAEPVPPRVTTLAGWAPDGVPERYVLGWEGSGSAWIDTWCRPRTEPAPRKPEKIGGRLTALWTLQDGALVVVGAGGRLGIWTPAADCGWRRETPLPSTLAVDVSPHGVAAIRVGEQGLEVYGYDRGNPTVARAVPGDPPTAAAMTPKGLLWGSKRGWIASLHLTSGPDTSDCGIPPGEVMQLVASGDGKLVAFRTRENAVGVLDLANCGVAHLKARTATFTTLAWSADGERLLAATSTGSVHAWAQAGGWNAESFELPGDELAIHRLVAHGSRIWALGVGGRAVAWSLEPRDWLLRACTWQYPTETEGPRCKELREQP
jgi:hypothetical protein